MTGHLAVAIDVSAVPSDPRGAGRYVLDLTAALAARGNVELHLATRRDDARRWAALAPAARVQAVVPVRRPARLAWEQAAAGRVVNRWPVAVYHGPHYTMPPGLRVPRVVTVHDLTFFDHPEWHERRKIAFFRRAIRVAAARADAIVCVSDATQRRLHELLDPQVPVHVVPHGVDHDRFRPEPGPDDEALREAAGAVGPYLLFVGTMEPRKNVAGLVAAFDRLAGDHPDLRLVLVGGRGWDEGGLDAGIRSSRHRDRITLTGYVSDETVAALLRGSVAVVYPAFVEGFGLPALEALACGVPVVTTAGSVMDDIAAGAAVTAPVGDVGALADAIDAVVGDDAARGERRQRGLEVAARYTWAETAAGHELVYAGVAAGRL